MRTVSDFPSVRDLLEGSGRARPAGPASYPTGFDPLDQVLGGGLKPQDLVVVGGRPGIGKTILMVQWARHLATAGTRVGIVSFEHRPSTLIERLHRLERAEEVVAHGTELRRAEAIAWEALETYGHLLHVVGGSRGTSERELVALVTGACCEVVFVDYVQKVPGGDVGAATALLRDLASSTEAAVVTASALTAEGLTARRPRLQHLQGAAWLSHEADVVLMLSEKATAISKVHSAFDSSTVGEHRDRVVMTVEKNRGGVAPVALEYRKAFADFRFDPAGAHVAEHLVDDLLYVD